MILTCDFCNDDFNIIEKQCETCDETVYICSFCLISYHCVNCSLSDSVDIDIDEQEYISDEDNY